MYTSIYIQTTLDAEGIMKNYPSPSLDETKPTSISHAFAYMVATSNSVSGDGTGELTVSAKVGDTVRFCCSSASNNFDDAVILYQISRFGGGTIFTEFSAVSYLAVGISPSGSNTLPMEEIEGEEFDFLEATVDGLGSEWYGLTFALYKRNPQGVPSIFGYFQWSTMFTATQ